MVRKSPWRGVEGGPAPVRVSVFASECDSSTTLEIRRGSTPRRERGLPGWGHPRTWPAVREVSGPVGRSRYRDGISDHRDDGAASVLRQDTREERLERRRTPTRNRWAATIGRSFQLAEGVERASKDRWLDAKSLSFAGRRQRATAGAWATIDAGAFPCCNTSAPASPRWTPERTD